MIFPSHLHPKGHTQGPLTRTPPPCPGPYPSNINIINTIDKKLNVPLPDLARFYMSCFYIPLWSRWETTQESPEHLQEHLNHTKCYFKKKREEKKAEEKTAPGRGKRCIRSARGLFMYSPLYFYELQRMDWNPANPSISQFYDCGQKEAKRGRILISIVNNKLEKQREIPQSSMSWLQL